MIILDFGSGNTCKNDKRIVDRMIAGVAGIIADTDTVIKWQLFEKAGCNIPLSHEIFNYAYNYAAALGIQTTASVFDTESLRFLETFKVPFVKISCDKEFTESTPSKYPLIRSVSHGIPKPIVWIKYLLCVPKYPAEVEDYAGYNWLYDGISDHTVGLDLYRKYKPAIWEKHFRLKDSTGLDAGPFAITPEELEKVL